MTGRENVWAKTHWWQTLVAHCDTCRCFEIKKEKVKDMNKPLQDCIKIQQMNGTYNTPLGAVARKIMADMEKSRGRSRVRVRNPKKRNAITRQT